MERVRLFEDHWFGSHFGGVNRACRSGAKRGPRRDGDTRLIESRIVLELQSARGIRSAYGSIGT